VPNTARPKDFWVGIKPGVLVFRRPAGQTEHGQRAQSRPLLRQQAGIFEVGGLEGERLEQVLTVTCPSILFPYGREAIDALVTKGSFPALMLAPINFEAVYMQAKRQQATEQQVPVS